MLGNLRQIGLTVNLYSSENRGILVPVKDDTANLHFTDLLAVYAQREIKNISDNALKGVNPIFKCPTYENDPARNATRFYVWGYGMSTQILLPERQNHNWTSDAGGKSLLQLITHPTRRPLVSESNDFHLLATNPSFVRHTEGSANVLFVDGHVGLLKRAQLAAALANPGLPY